MRITNAPARCERTSAEGERALTASRSHTPGAMLRQRSAGA